MLPDCLWAGSILIILNKFNAIPFVVRLGPAASASPKLLRNAGFQPTPDLWNMKLRIGTQQLVKQILDFRVPIEPSLSKVKVTPPA